MVFISSEIASSDKKGKFLRVEWFPKMDKTPLHLYLIIWLLV
jgi:hypothetical protein